MKQPAARARRPLARGLRGLTVLDTLVGAAIGAIVISGFLLFWAHSSFFQRDASENTRQESSGLTALNRIAKDVGDAQAIGLADDKQLVLIQRNPDGSNTWVRYAVDAAGNLSKQVRTGAPATYDPDNPGFGPAPTDNYLARAIQPARNGAPFFSYSTKAGTPLSAANIPAYTPGNAASINRVDIAFAAATSKGRGYVELHTSAAISTGPAGAVDPYRPACPDTTWLRGDPFGILEWDMTGQTTEFRIYRTGGLVAGTPLPARTFTIAASTDQEAYQFSDSDAAGSTQPIDYRVVAAGAGGESQGCGATTWYPRLATPTVTVSLDPPATESYNWPAGQTSATVNVTWAPVTSANSYEVYRRPLDNKTLNPTGSFTLAGPMVSQQAAPSYSEPIGWDTAYEYQVVAQGPMPESSYPSPGQKVLSHAAPVSGDVVADPLDYNKNVISWDGRPGPTATGIAIYRHDLSGCYPTLSAWTKIGTVSLNAGQFTDTTAQLGTRYEYALGAYNTGPRGKVGTAQYASMFSAADDALQYPANPTTSAVGSTGGPTALSIVSAGTNRVSWVAGCASTTDTIGLDFYGSGSSAASAALLDHREFSADSGTYSDPNIPRASIRWYKASAFNETGASTNAETTTGAVAAYQYPNNPQSPVTTSATNYYSYTVSRDVYYQNNDSAWLAHPPTSPPPGEGTCTKTSTTNHWVASLYYSSGHDDTQRGYDSNGNMEPSGGNYLYAHWHYSSVPYYDTYACDRYSAYTMFSWPSGHPADDESYAFCGQVAGATCSYAVAYRYTGASSGSSVCSVASGTSCTVWWYSGSYTEPTYNVSAVDSFTVTNPGGSLKESVASSVPPPAPNGAPGAPSFVVKGSTTNPDGTGLTNEKVNTISFTKVSGATGYKVVRYETYSGNAVSTTTPVVVADTTSPQTGCTANYKYCVRDLDDSTPVKRGTEYYYSVIAYNTAGPSATPAPKPAYQLPVVPTVTQTKDPTDDDPVVGFSFNRAADLNQPAGGRFCDTSRGACTYRFQAFDSSDGTLVDTFPVPRGSYTTNIPLPPGLDVNFVLHTCNTGGCVDKPITCSPACSAPPGKFKFVDAGDQRENNGVRYAGDQLLNTDESGDRTVYQATLQPTWSASEGAVKYKVGRVDVGTRDNFHRIKPAPFDGTVESAVSTGFGASGNPLQRTDVWQSTPGAVYKYTVWAIGKNKKKTSTTFKVLTPPAKAIFTQAGMYCNAGQPADRWKGGYWFVPDATSYDKTVYVDRFKYAYWAGRLTPAQWGGVGNPDVTGANAIAQLRQHAGITQNKTDLGNNLNGWGNWASDWHPETWDQQQDDTGYWYSSLPGNGGVPQDLSSSPGMVREYTGDDVPSRALGNADRTVFAFKMWSWIDKDALGVDGGGALTENNGLVVSRDGNYAPSGPTRCGTATDWHKTNVTSDVGRWASKYTGYTSAGHYGDNPSSSGWAGISR